MRYEGTVYRPPSEAGSLIVQATIGCAHNRCRFCTMYKDKRFRIRDFEEVKRDFREARSRYGPAIEKVFLADGDALALPPERLEELLEYVAGLFPGLKSISAYGSPMDILRRSDGELRMLREAGLAMVYMGAESGDDRVLLKMDKGATAGEIAAAGLKLKEAGLKSSVTLISGLGGSERLREHALGSAKLISRMKPDYLGFLTLLLEDGAPVLEDMRRGEFTLLSPEETVEEMSLFLENVDSEGTVFRANHASNYLTLKGTLNADIPAMLRELEAIREAKAFRREGWRRL